MTERAPHILFVLVHRHNADYFIPLAEALERRGARVSFLSTDWSVQGAARRRGRAAPNVMHTRLIGQPPKRPQEGVSLENITRYVIDNPSVDVYYLTLFAQADRLIRAYGQHFDRLQPDMVVGWNGTKPEARAAMKLAESRGIATLYFEQGNFPNTIVADPKGVNWEGSMRGFAVPREYNRARIDEWLEAFRSRRLPAAQPSRHLAAALRVAVLDALLNFFARRSPFHPTLYFDHEKSVSLRRFFRRVSRILRSHFRKEAPARAEPLDLPEPFVLLPLQVHDDTQVIVHSPRMRTMEELVDAAVTALPAGYGLVVKTHPADEGRRRYAVIEEMLDGKRFRLVHRADTTDLIRRSSAVVTLNSSVGLEALAFMKPVVVLGDAVYAGRGITVDVADPDELPLKLSKAVRFRPDEDDVKRFLDYFVFEYSRRGSHRDPQGEDLDAMAEYVLSQRMPAQAP